MKNVNARFNGFQFRSAIKFGRDFNMKSFQDDSKIGIINIHEPVQVTREGIYLPFVQRSLDTFPTHTNIPIYILLAAGVSISDSFLNNPH